MPRFKDKLAADSNARDAYMRRTQLWKVMQTMDPNDPTYMDYEAEYNSLEAAANEYALQPTFAKLAADYLPDAVECPNCKKEVFPKRMVSIAVCPECNTPLKNTLNPHLDEPGTGSTSSEGLPF